MKDDLLALLPKSIQTLLQKSSGTLPEKRLIDLAAEDAEAYGFQPEETAPCIHAAYYVLQSASFPEDFPEDHQLSIVFPAAWRSALKLLSYGKYNAVRSENGWMKYGGKP